MNRPDLNAFISSNGDSKEDLMIRLFTEGASLVRLGWLIGAAAKIYQKNLPPYFADRARNEDCANFVELARWVAGIRHPLTQT